MEDLLNIIKVKYETLEGKYYNCIDIIYNLEMKCKILEKEKNILENRILDIERINKVYRNNCKIDIKC